jgi:WD40 repeat protein
VDILILEGKKTLGDQVHAETLTFFNFLYTDNYFLTTFDLWLLITKYEIPTIFISHKWILQSKHQKHEFIGYGDDDLTIITMAWDKTIKVHKDDRDEQKKSKENVMRARTNCHTKDIISGDYSHNLGLIATGSRDHNVRIWDYEKVKQEDEIKAHEVEVTTVKFLKPLPLLLTADSKGVMYIWLIHPHPDGKKCIVKWTNKHSMESDVPISAVDSYFNE